MPARSVLLIGGCDQLGYLRGNNGAVMRRCPAAPVSASNHSSTHVTLSRTQQSRIEGLQEAFLTGIQHGQG